VTEVNAAVEQLADCYNCHGSLLFRRAKAPLSFLFQTVVWHTWCRICFAEIALGLSETWI
jgi:hypothetical protein